MHQGVLELSRYLIPGPAHAQRSTRLSIFTIRISTLDHKTFNDAMEQEAVVKMLISKLDKIISMQWSLIVEDSFHSPERSFNLDVSNSLRFAHVNE